MEELSGSSSRKRQHGTLCSDGDDDDVPMHCPKKSQSSVFSDVQQEFGSDSAVSEGYDTDYGDGMEDEEELEMKTPEVYGGMSRRVSTVRDWPSGCGPLAARVVARDNEEYAGDDGLDGEIVADDYRLDDFEPDYDDDDEEQEGFQSESSVCETQELVMITGAEDGAESDGSDDDVDWDSWLGPESDLDDVGEAKEEKSTIGIMMTRHLDDEIEEGSRGYDDDEVSTAHGPTAVRVVTCGNEEYEGDNGQVDEVKKGRKWYLEDEIEFEDEIELACNWYGDDEYLEEEGCSDHARTSEESGASNYQIL